MGKKNKRKPLKQRWIEWKGKAFFSLSAKEEKERKKERKKEEGVSKPPAWHAQEEWKQWLYLFNCITFLFSSRVLPEMKRPLLSVKVFSPLKRMPYSSRSPFSTLHFFCRRSLPLPFILNKVLKPAATASWRIVSGPLLFHLWGDFPPLERKSILWATTEKRRMLGERRTSLTQFPPSTFSWLPPAGICKTFLPFPRL